MEIIIYILLLIVYLTPIISFYTSDNGWLASFSRSVLLFLLAIELFVLFIVSTRPPAADNFNETRAVLQFALCMMMGGGVLLILYYIPVSLLYRWSLKIKNHKIALFLKLLIIGLLILPAYEIYILLYM